MNKKLDRNYYDILEIERTADDAAIKKGYKRAALVHHPDKGGSDEMFQQVHEAFQVLSDSSKRSEYDKDLKKYNLKDGLPKTAGAAKKTNGFQGSSGRPEEQSRQEEKSAPKQTFVEIPQNLSGLSIKDLKQLLEGLGMKHDDCFEKKDLIARVQEFKDNRRGGSSTGSATSGAPNTSQPPPSSTSAPKQSATQSQSPSSNYSCQPPTEQVAFKIISVGNAEVGKSCLIKRYCEEKFVDRYIQTIGIDYGVKKLKIKGQTVAINFFDMSGNEDYKLIRTEFYADACGVLMVFDLDNRDSFNSLVHWEDEMRKSGGIDMSRIKIIVCGNKVDIKGSREVKTQDAQKWAKSKGWDYFETSAQSGSNVSEAFLSLFEACHTQFLNDRKTFGMM